eukprot:486878_1
MAICTTHHERRYWLIRHLKDSTYHKKLKIGEIFEMIHISAKLKCYDDMFKYVHQLLPILCKNQETISFEIRGAFSTYFNDAYNMILSKRLNTWDQICTDDCFAAFDQTLLNKYKIFIRNEIEQICEKGLNILKTHIFQENGSNFTYHISNVIYHKLFADFNRYLLHIHPAHEVYKLEAKTYYDKALKMVKSDLRSCHYVALELTMNASIFYYEILGEQEKACEMSRNICIDAIPKLDMLNQFEDSTKSITYCGVMYNLLLRVWRRNKEDVIKIANGFVREMESVLYKSDYLTVPKNIIQILIKYYYIEPKNLW